MFIYFYSDILNEHCFREYINTYLYNYSNVKYINNPNILKELINLNDINNVFIITYLANHHLFNMQSNSKIYVLNTEQLSKIEWVNNLKNISLPIVDYSLENVNILKKYKNDVYYLPYLCNKNEIYNLEKIRDVAFIGSIDNYRKQIMDKIPNLNIIEGFDETRDLYLFTHKILLNIHFNERFKILEEMRCNRCIFNKMIVITEESLNRNYELKEYIIECKYENLVETTIEVLNNYDYYYNKLFKNFDLEKISNHYKNISDKSL